VQSVTKQTKADMQDFSEGPLLAEAIQSKEDYGNKGEKKLFYSTDEVLKLPALDKLGV
jgi:hypothetical protein